MTAKEALDAATDAEPGERKPRKPKRLWLAWNAGRVMDCHVHAHPLGHEVVVHGYIHSSKVFPTRDDALREAEARIRELLAEGWTDLTAKPVTYDGRPLTRNGGHGPSDPFRDVPRRIFLDSSTLQTLHTYGAFLYEGESLSVEDRIHRDPRGLAKLEALRLIMQIDQRASFDAVFHERRQSVSGHCRLRRVAA